MCVLGRSCVDVCACGMRKREGESGGEGSRDQPEEETGDRRQAIAIHFLAFTVSIEEAKIKAYRITTNKGKERREAADPKSAVEHMTLFVFLHIYSLRLLFIHLFIFFCT